MKVEIKEISPTSAGARELFALLDQNNLLLCAPEICHLTKPEEMEAAKSTLLGIFCDDILCGMGGLKYFDQYAEVTRMFVKEKFRNQGLARKLLNELEITALRQNKSLLRLETNENLKHAVRLYVNAGFQNCAPFGDYSSNPTNIHLEKSIAFSR